MKIITYRIEKRPIERKPVTLADMPEEVDCIVQTSVHGFLQVRKRRENLAHFTDGDPSSGYLSIFMVVQRVDGQPLPQPKLPATLADDGVEEGRLYRCEWYMASSGIRCAIGNTVVGVNRECGELYLRIGCLPADYRIQRATDYVVVREEVTLC